MALESRRRSGLKPWNGPLCAQIFGSSHCCHLRRTQLRCRVWLHSRLVPCLLCGFAKCWRCHIRAPPVGYRAGHGLPTASSTFRESLPTLPWATDAACRFLAPRLLLAVPGMARVQQSWRRTWATNLALRGNRCGPLARQGDRRTARQCSAPKCLLFKDCIHGELQGLRGRGCRRQPTCLCPGLSGIAVRRSLPNGREESATDWYIVADLLPPEHTADGPPGKRFHRRRCRFAACEGRHSKASTASSVPHSRTGALRTRKGAARATSPQSF